MTWLPGSKGSSLEEVFGLRADLYDRYREFASLFWSSRPVDPPLLELCRWRVAQLLGCAPMPPMSASIDLGPARHAALGDWEKSDVFSGRERACLAFADRFVLDPHAISDADAAAVARHLSPAEMVAFTEALALLDGFTRFCAMLGIRNDDEGSKTP